MLFSTPSRFLFLFASLLSANAETIRGVQQERELTTVPAVDLGTAFNYRILAKTAITTTGVTAITGDIAVSPTAAASMTGFALILPVNGESSTSSLVTGNIYASDYADPTPTLLTTAVGAMITAYNDAAGRDTSVDVNKYDVFDTYNNLKGGLIGGRTLKSGVYTFASDVIIGSEVTLNGGANDIFIIQMTGNLVLAANQKVTLTGGAKAENIFWQVAGNVEVMAGAEMKGTLLVQTGVTFITGSKLNGRVFAQTACALQSATISN